MAILLQIRYVTLFATRFSWNINWLVYIRQIGFYIQFCESQITKSTLYQIYLLNSSGDYGNS